MVPAPRLAEIGERLDRARRRAGLLSEIREAIFGAQDGLVSTLAVVSTVSGATNDRFAVLVAGIAAGLAGSSAWRPANSCRARASVRSPLPRSPSSATGSPSAGGDVEAELAYMLEEEGLPDDEAASVAAVIGRHPEILLNTTVEKAFGMALDDGSGSPLQGSLIMGAAFGLGTLAPILPYVLLPVDVAIYASVLATAGVLFGIGVAKARWTGGNPVLSGLEILIVGAFAGVAGYLFGDILPTLRGNTARRLRQPMRYAMTVEIDRPIEEVWAWMGDIFNAPRLRGMSLGGRQTSKGPIGVGSTYEFRAMVLGFETVIVGEVTEWDPPHASTATASGRPVKSFRLRETFERIPTGTRVVRDLEFELPLALRVLWPIIGPLVLRRWRTATANIKRLIESTPSESAAPARAAPSGIETHLTMMFTDIVGSTALITVIGDPAWRDLRRWHDATLRTHFERHAGREVDHAGDGFLVAFEEAASAVGCAIEIQRSLVEHRRVSGFAPSVRIGLHTGKVHRDGSAFAGAALHVASRVAASAGAGQILATAATVQEAEVATGLYPSR